MTRGYAVVAQSRRKKCEGCRQHSKFKCSGESEGCSRCAEREIECVYALRAPTKLQQEKAENPDDDQPVKHTAKRKARGFRAEDTKRRRMPDGDEEELEPASENVAEQHRGADALGLDEAKYKNTVQWRHWMATRAKIEVVPEEPEFTPYEDPVHFTKLPVFANRAFRVKLVSHFQHKKGSDDVWIRTITVEDANNPTTTLVLFQPTATTTVKDVGGILEAHICPDDATARSIGEAACPGLDRIPVNLKAWSQYRQGGRLRRMIHTHALQTALGDRFVLDEINENYTIQGGIRYDTLDINSKVLVIAVKDTRSAIIKVPCAILTSETIATMKTDDDISLNLSIGALNIDKIISELPSDASSWRHKSTEITLKDTCQITAREKEAVLGLVSFVRFHMIDTVGRWHNLQAFRDALVDPYLLSTYARLRQYGCVNGQALMHIVFEVTDNLPRLYALNEANDAVTSKTKLCSILIKARCKVFIAFVFWLLAEAFSLELGWLAAWDQALLGASAIGFRRLNRAALIEMMVNLANVKGFFVCMSCFRVAKPSVMCRHEDGRAICKWCAKKHGSDSATFGRFDLRSRVNKSAYLAYKVDKRYVPDIIDKVWLAEMRASLQSHIIDNEVGTYTDAYTRDDLPPRNANDGSWSSGMNSELQLPLTWVKLQPHPFSVSLEAPFRTAVRDDTVVYHDPDHNSGLATYYTNIFKGPSSACVIPLLQEAAETAMLKDEKVITEQEYAERRSHMYDGFDNLYAIDSKTPPFKKFKLGREPLDDNVRIGMSQESISGQWDGVLPVNTSLFATAIHLDVERLKTSSRYQAVEDAVHEEFEDWDDVKRWPEILKIIGQFEERFGYQLPRVGPPGKEVPCIFTLPGHMPEDYSHRHIQDEFRARLFSMRSVCDAPPREPVKPPKPDSPKPPKPDSPKGPEPESPKGPKPELPDSPKPTKPESPEGPKPELPDIIKPETPIKTESDDDRMDWKPESASNMMNQSTRILDSPDTLFLAMVASICKHKGGDPLFHMKMTHFNGHKCRLSAARGPDVDNKAPMFSGFKVRFPTSIDDWVEEDMTICAEPWIVNLFRHAYPKQIIEAVVDDLRVKIAKECKYYSRLPDKYPFKLKFPTSSADYNKRVRTLRSGYSDFRLKEKSGQGKTTRNEKDDEEYSLTFDSDEDESDGEYDDQESDYE